MESIFSNNESTSKLKIENCHGWLWCSFFIVLLLGSSVICDAKDKDRASKEETQMVHYKEMIEWFKENFEHRANLLEQHTGQPFDLSYQYQSSSSRDKKLRGWIETLQEKKLPKSEREKYSKEAEIHAKACLEELEQIRASLATAEALASKEWKKKTGSGESPEGKGQIFGTDIDAEQLGVILDNSGSMTPYLERLKEEISRDFSQAYTLEVKGCDIDETFDFPWYFCMSEIYGNPFHPALYISGIPQTVDFDMNDVRGDVPSAFTAMIDIIQTDTIYWFCDFNGEYDYSMVKKLTKKILDADVTLFVHTSDEDPPKEIEKLVEKSGGKVITVDF